MMFDAVILAGGRARRLGGASKPTLVHGGDSLLELAVRAASGARRIVVVGDVAAKARYSVTRESPPFAGPVAAIAAGLEALEDPASPLVLVLACDMPGVAGAVGALLATPVSHDGVIARDATGSDQYLAAIYRRAALASRLTGIEVQNASMRSLIAGLDLRGVSAPPGSTDDVDTWQDAERLGVSDSATRVTAQDEGASDDR